MNYRVTPLQSRGEMAAGVKSKAKMMSERKAGGWWRRRRRLWRCVGEAGYNKTSVFYTTRVAPGYNVDCNMVVERVAGPEDWCRACRVL